MNARHARWLLLGTALVQAVAPTLAALAGGFTGGGAELPVVPPGAFFAVWTIPVVGGLACALWGLPLHRATSWPYREVQLPLSVAQVGFAVWLAAASSPWPVLSLPVFLVMLAALLPAMGALTRAPAAADPTSTRPGQRRGLHVTHLLLGVTVGVYAGWTTAAVWVNAASLLPATGPAGSDPGRVALQCLAVVGAGGAAAAGARAFRAQLPYVATAAFALVGVGISAARADVPALLITALVALTAVVSVATVTRLRTAPPPHRPAAA